MSRAVEARPHARGQAPSLLGRLLTIAAIAAIATLVAVLDAAATVADPEDDTTTVRAEHLLAAEVAVRQGNVSFTAALAEALRTPRGLLPHVEMVDTDTILAQIERNVEATAEEAPAATVEAARDAVWDRLAQCESSGDWHINTGNGFYGGLQFTLQSWQWVGGTGYPHEHSREVQIQMAERLLERQGWIAWPACSRQLGLR